MSVSTADACHNETRLKLFVALSGDDRRRQHSEKDVQGKKKMTPARGVKRKLPCRGRGARARLRTRSGAPTRSALNPGIVMISHTHTMTQLLSAQSIHLTCKACNPLLNKCSAAETQGTERIHTDECSRPTDSLFTRRQIYMLSLSRNKKGVGNKNRTTIKTKKQNKY